VDDRNSEIEETSFNKSDITQKRRKSEEYEQAT
jgi:hypothetical protein